MINAALEVVKLVGAIAGLASSAFLVWDRVYRSRPIFGLHIVQGEAQGSNYVYLRFKNVVDEDLIIDDIVATPPHLAPALDRELDSMVRAAAHAGFGLLTIGPLNERKLPLLFTRPRADEKENEPVKITATWRTTRRRWPWKRTATIVTSGAEVKRLQEARQGKRP
jgi:hypothetical protein